MRADAKHLLRAFVALCEIHWRSFWLWRGGVLARYGRGPTPNPVEPLGSVRGPTPSPSRLREGNFGVAATLRHPTFRHAELGSASYFLSAVGIKILKQVQDDGGWCRDDGGVSGCGRTPSIFFVPLWLCARYIGAALSFGGAACSRAMGEGLPLIQWSLSDQSGGPPLTPPACGRGILACFGKHRFQIMPRVARRDLDHIFGRAFGDDLSALHAAFGA